MPTPLNSAGVRAVKQKEQLHASKADHIRNHNQGQRQLSANQMEEHVMQHRRQTAGQKEMEGLILQAAGASPVPGTHSRKSSVSNLNPADATVTPPMSRTPSGNVRDAASRQKSNLAADALRRKDSKTLKLLGLKPKKDSLPETTGEEAPSNREKDTNKPPQTKTVLSPRSRKAAEAAQKHRERESVLAAADRRMSAGKKKKQRKKKTVTRVMAALEKVQTMDQLAKQAPDMLFAFENDMLKERQQKELERAEGKLVKFSDPYHEQGDHYFDTHHMKIQRSRLRHHPDVVLELKRFWKFISQEPAATFMLKSHYTEMHICINKGLRQDFEAQQLRDDLRKLALWDWSHDMQNAQKRQQALDRKREKHGGPPEQYYIDDHCMSREAFYDGVFELVDLWTQTVIPDEYVSFLRQLRYRISAPFQEAMEQSREREANGEDEGNGKHSRTGSLSRKRGKGKGLHGAQDGSAGDKGRAGSASNGAGGAGGAAGRGGRGFNAAGADGRGRGHGKGKSGSGEPADNDGNPVSGNNDGGNGGLFGDHSDLKKKLGINTFQSKLQRGISPFKAAVQTVIMIRRTIAGLNADAKAGKLGRGGLAGIRRMSQTGPDGKKFDFRSSATFWDRKPYKMKTVDSLHVCAICQSEVQGDLHMCPHTRPQPKPEYMLLHNRKATRKKVRPRSARLHPEHMFAPLPVTVGELSHSPTEADNTTAKRWENNRIEAEAKTQSRRPQTAGPLHSTKTTGVPPDAALQSSTNEQAGTLQRTPQVTGNTVKKVMRTRPQTAGAAVGRGDMERVEEETEKTVLSLRVTVTTPRGSSMEDDATGQAKPNQSDRKKLSRSSLRPPGLDDEVKSAKDDAEQTVDPRDLPMPDDVAYALARGAVLKIGMQMEVVDNHSNWLKCVLLAANTSETLTVKLVDHDWTWDQVPDTHVRIIGTTHPLTEHLDLRRRRLQHQHLQRMQQRRDEKGLDPMPATAGANGRTSNKHKAPTQPPRELGSLRTRPASASVVASKNRNRAIPAESGHSAKRKTRPVTAGDSFRNSSLSGKPWGRSSGHKARMVFRPKHTGMEF